MEYKNYNKLVTKTKKKQRSRLIDTENTLVVTSGEREERGAYKGRWEKIAILWDYMQSCV